MRVIRPDASLDDLQAEREERGQVVRDCYNSEKVGPVTWVVSHPTEPGRTYVVDMAERTCSCPDFECFCRGHELDCKHLSAVIPTYERETGRTVEPRRVFQPESDGLAAQRAVRRHLARLPGATSREVVPGIGIVIESGSELGGINDPGPDPYALDASDPHRADFRHYRKERT